MKKLMNFLMLSCQKASALIEKRLQFPLNAIEKFQLYSRVPDDAGQRAAA